ncbi:hypothetical protein QL093DRAFT_2383753 [Fusarium oxysporum]|nr:hypothetical protein QL093DRAFT_2383753 [Fusarium oxysporum]
MTPGLQIGRSAPMLRHGHKPFAVEAPGQMVPSFVVCISASRETLDLLGIKHIITGPFPTIPTPFRPSALHEHLLA